MGKSKNLLGSKDLFQSIKDKGIGKNRENRVQMIDVDKIDIVENIRDSYEDIDELKQSIMIHGIQSPIKVIEKHGRYKLVFGHRRYLAMKKCAEENENFSKIPCIIEADKSADEIIELQLIENIDRDDLKDFEKSIAIDKYKKMTGKSNIEIAERFGKKEKWVRDSLSSLEIIKNIESLTATISKSDENNSSPATNLNYRNIPTGIVVETKGLDVNQQKELLNKFINDGLQRKDVRELKKKLETSNKGKKNTKKISKEKIANKECISIVIDNKKYVLKKTKLDKIQSIIKYIEASKDEDDTDLLKMFKYMARKFS
jgi:ParB/RepB/Spo0J family partition protein